MDIIKRILVVILILFLVIAGFALFALKSGFFTVDARDYVISLIKKDTGKDVRIGRIELGLYNNIVVHDVSMPVAMTFAEKGEFATIKSIIIRFNLLDLISRKKDINSTLSSIIIDQPLIYLKKEKDRFNLADFASSFTLPAADAKNKNAVVLPLNKIFIQNGKVVYEDKDNTFNSYVDNFSGTILLKDNPMLLRINLSGKTKNSDKNNFKLDFDYYIGNSRFRGNIKISDAALNDWGAYLMQPKDFTINSGGFYVDAAASGTGLKPDQMKIYGYAEVKDGSIMIKNKIPVTEIDGVVEINSDRVNIKKAFFKVYGGKGVVKGAATEIFGNMNFYAKAGITGIDLGEFDALNLTGTAKVYADVSGNKDKQTADLNVAMAEGVIRGMPIKDISIKASLKEKIIKLDEVKGAIGSGSLIGGGTVDLKKGKNNFNISILAGGLDAQKISGLKEISGSMDLGLRVQGPLDKPKINAELKSVKIKYSGNDIGDLLVKITADGGKITFNSSMAYKNYKKLSLNSIINITDDKISIGNFKLQNGKDTLVDAKGGLLIKDGVLGVTVTARDIMLSDLALGFLKGKDIDGAVKGSIFLRGTKDKPEVEMNLNMSNLKIRGSYYKVTAAVKYADDVIKMSNVDFNGNLKGSGELSLKKKIFNANFDIKSLDGGVISEFTGAKLLDDGKVDGKIYVIKEASGYGGNVNLDVSYLKGMYKGATIDVSGANNDFIIKQLDIRQKKGILKASGNFSIKQDLNIKAVINGVLDGYRFNDKLQAEAVFVNSLDIFLGDDQAPFIASDIFNASKILFNGKPQDDLDASAKLSGKSMPEFKIKWGKGYNAEGSINAEPDMPVVDALIQLKDADLYRVYTLLNNREKPLAKDSLVSGEFNITGPANRAKFTGNLNQAQGTTSGEGYVSLEKKKGIYSLSSFGIKYSAVDVNLKNLINIFDENFKDTGTLNGSGDLRGETGRLESAGNVTLTAGKVADMPYDSIRADYIYKDKKVVLNKGEFNYKESYLKLDGSSFEIKADNDYYATILAQMKDFSLKNYKFNGNLNFYGHIVNDKVLKIKGSLGSDNFMFRKHQFGSFLLNVNFEDKVLSLKSSKGKNTINAELEFGKDSIEFKKYTATEPDGNLMINVTGAVQMRKDAQSDVLISVKDVDPQMVNDLLGWDHTWKGLANGNVKISGNTEKGVGITVFVTLSNGMVDGVDFDTVSGIVAIKDDAVNLSPIGNIVMTKTDKYIISVGGKIPVPLSPGSLDRLKGSEMNLNVKMKGGDLSVFKFLKFIDDASGPVDLDLVIKGTREYPSVSGKMNITGGNIKLKYLFRDLKNVYANILFKDNVIDIYTMKADTERGTIKVENLDEKKGGIMRLMKPYEVNWRITNVGDKVRFTDTDYMDFISGDADLDLAMTGLMDSPFVKGTMKFENARLVYPLKTRNKAGEQTDVKDNFVKRITWDVSVTGGENVHYYNNYYNNFADLTMKFYDGVPIRFYDKGNDMKIYGSVGITRGTYKYMNTELQMDDMKQSKITFDNDRRAILDIYATASLKKFALNKNMGAQIISRSETTDLNIYVRFAGRIGNVNLDLTSDPPLDRNRLLYILTFGKDQDKDLSPADAVKYLDAIANSWLRSTVSSIVPSEIVQIDVKVQGIVPVSTAESVTRSAEDTTNIEVGIGHNIGTNWYVEYRPKLVDITNKFNIQHTIGAELSLDSSSKVVLEGILKDRSIDPVNTFEGRASYKLSIPFDSWGAKPKPTATPAKTPVKQGN